MTVPADRIPDWLPVKCCEVIDAAIANRNYMPDEGAWVDPEGYFTVIEIHFTNCGRQTIIQGPWGSLFAVDSCGYHRGHAYPVRPKVVQIVTYERVE